MFMVKERSQNKQVNNEKRIYKGYTVIEYLRDGKAIVWSGNKAYTLRL
ncbi:MAG: hypothetical protein ACP5GZ_07615 [Vulcanisaeta sp.]|mgnify:CR=1 FL=1|jgi:hypothetical protein|uniref:Uncharacterized protein n=1 Tax=Vulcanisaeta moutnovskia (strain 768-28) TaxID=985053 RepID=F0QXK3_VULM7|nr:hypothetical protein [Vulcanisaeta moutnovskia]ADY02418.1 hypothetical protein VMUT_2222 [Vulcanisaeta moutnovskia 768-28]